MGYKIFVINLGSSSTKVACFDNEQQLFITSVRHPAPELQTFKRAVDQSDYRFKAVLKMAEEQGCNLSQIDLFMSRGGLLRPAPGGVYAINQRMLNDLLECRYGEHACNAGPVIAHKLSVKYDKPAFIKDPPTVDEFDDMARATGLPFMKRVSRFHALNQKEAARRVAVQLKKKYEECRFIVAHLGGGITVGVHENGRVVDASNPNDEGPLSTDRTGTLPNMQLVEFCFSENRTREDVNRILFGQGGLLSYTGSTDLKEILLKSENDPEVKLLLETMLYRISFWICGFAARLKGNVDGIVITGGMAHNCYIVNTLRERVGFLAPFFVFPGEFEMEALAAGGLNVLEGREIVKEY
jgi:butyrate kinase